MKSKGINPNIKSKWRIGNEPKSVDYYFNGIVNGDRYILSEAISLVESSVSKYSIVALELLDRCHQLKTTSFRIGITGSPGVGKSSFIEQFGLHLLEKENKKVAVLAIDPSSSITKGSILGDKTRMQVLSNSTNAFIRPSPSQNCLGGISSATKEIVCLCEAAGYDVIMIETVGVGQSETMVSELVDLFVLLLLPGAGDEIQGIKRGIVEMADLILVNKSDGDRIPLSKIIQRNYKNAIHLFQAKEHGQAVEVLRCSSLEKIGMDNIWNVVDRFFKEITKSNYISESRLRKDENWFNTSVLLIMERMIMNQSKYKDALEKLRLELKSAQISPFAANAKFSKILTSR